MPISPQTLHGPAGLAEFSEECAKFLFSTVQYNFVFPPNVTIHNWPVDQIKKTNQLFLSRLRNRANIYCIFTRSSEQLTDWNPMYVGERKSVGLRERVTQHLIKKDHRTGSMLDAVKAAVVEGKEIGLSFVNIKPESLRLYVEEIIISDGKKKGLLSWNTHG